MLLLFTLTLLLLSASMCEAAPNCGVICNMKPESEECKKCIKDKVTVREKRWAKCSELWEKDRDGYWLCQSQEGRH
ncbi:hypothetical protein PRIPAC_86609 [Pristionchus pacificus]|uniref:Uncharacterized protein n=1 Tax=Pristionchus pacificus TaxID=54126 RepID=A0A454XX68_PRIPA|nr:hypothetical protein PRIPAC_86609 [Pristionchus pacificus]|eukprot:PDM67575.1 hypothetical protein PRIPAC_48992 [Pristionchus pacificus]